MFAADARPAAAGGAAGAAAPAAAECIAAVHAAPHGRATCSQSGHQHAAALPEHAGPGGSPQGSLTCSKTDALLKRVEFTT